MNNSKILSGIKLKPLLDEIRSSSNDYDLVFNNIDISIPIIDIIQGVRERIDPEKPFFFGQLPNGIRYAGDARDLPAILHRLFPDFNQTLISALINETSNREGDFFDVGTNIGVVAASVARHIGPHRTIHAFEPSPAVFKLAAATLALNGLENVILTEAAVSDDEAEIPFYSTPENSAVASLVKHDYGFLTKWVPISVLSHRIDSIVKDRGCKKISTIKIDVEGQELSVIKGSQETLKRLHPTVVFEYTPAVAASQNINSSMYVEEFIKAGNFEFEVLVEPIINSSNTSRTDATFPDNMPSDRQYNVFARSI